MSFLSRWLGGGQTASHPLIQPADYQARFVDGKQAHTLVDVRMPDEFRSGYIPGAVNISLQDLSGNQWFSQFVWHKVGYAKRLNLRGMPDGVYTLSVKHRDATVIQVLRLSKGNLELSKQKQVEMPAGSEQVSR